MPRVRFHSAIAILTAASLTGGAGPPDTLGPKPRVSTRALTLMDAAATRLQRAKTISAALRVEQTYDGKKRLRSTTFQARRPGDLYMENVLELATDSGPPMQFHEFRAMASGTGSIWEYNPSDTSGYKNPLEGRGGWNQARVYAGPLSGFFSEPGDHDIAADLWLPTRRHDPTLRDLADEGTVELDGVRLEVVRWVKLYHQGDAPPGATGAATDEDIDTTRFYFATGVDTTVRRIVSTSSRAGDREETVVTELALDGMLADSIFAAKSPAALKTGESGIEERGSPVGDTLPNFVLSGIDSTGRVRAVSLDSILARHQALMLWRWASH